MSAEPAPVFAIQRLDHVVLRVRDLARAIDFYESVLGCRVVKRRDDLGLVHLRAGASMIDLVAVDGALGRAGGPAAAATGRNMDHLCLRVEPFEPAALRAHLERHGAARVSGVHLNFGAEGDGESIYLDDPDGNVLELKGPPVARGARPAAAPAETSPARGASAPRLLLFDLGGVVLENATFDRLNALLPEPANVAALKTRWLRSPAVRSFELGLVTPHDFAAAFMSEWGLGGDVAAFLADFESWPTRLFPGAAALLARLRQRHRTACLSNSNVLHWHRFDGFREHFDTALSSHLLGAIKPDAACFEQALGVLGVDAGEVAFFDDSPLNVDAAAALGLRAFHVDGFEALERVLQAQALLA
jgi:putative hydrolase of the HAD superfamily